MDSGPKPTIFERLGRFLFRNQDLRQTVAKNTFWLTVSNFGGRFLRAGVIIYAARVLGATEWGVFSYALTIVTFLAIFTDLGISNIFLRETAKSQDPVYRSRLLSTSFILKMVLLAAGVLIVLTLAPKLALISADPSTVEKAKLLFPIVALILIFDTFREFGSSLTRALEKMEVEAALYIITNLGIVAFGFGFLYLEPSVTSFSWAYAAGTGLGMLATFYVLRRHFRYALSRFTPALIKPILTSAWPFAISSILSGLLINTDIFLIGLFRSTQEVGWYSADYRILQIFYLLPAIAAASLLPVFARLANRDDARLRSLLERALVLVLLIALPAAAGGVLLGREVITFVFGQSFLPGADAFRILMLTVVIDFSAVLLNGALFAYNLQRKSMIYAGIGGGLNVVFDLALIPAFGILGCALATFFAQFLSNWYLWRTVRRVNPVTVLPRLRKILLATAGMALGVIGFKALGLPVLLAVVLGGLLYFGLLAVLREPILAEVRFILQSLASDETRTRVSAVE